MPHGYEWRESKDGLGAKYMPRSINSGVNPMKPK